MALSKGDSFAPGRQVTVGTPAPLTPRVAGMTLPDTFMARPDVSGRKAIPAGPVRSAENMRETETTEMAELKLLNMEAFPAAFRVSLINSLCPLFFFSDCLSVFLSQSLWF